MQEIKNEWFATWFNTPYYHLLYNNRNYKEAENFITNLMQDLALPKTIKAMDLACGKGRHSIFLNKLGYDVLGLDLSENSIESAKQFENDRLKFDVHDMREVYQENSFDLILNLFTSFGYFLDSNEHIKVFESIYNQLKTDGIFVMDFLNVVKAVNQLIPHESKTVNDITFDIHKKVENGFIQKDIKFFADNESYHFQEFVKVLKLDYFVEVAKSVGLDLVKYYGDYELNSFDENNSPRLILVFKK